MFRSQKRVVTLWRGDISSFLALHYSPEFCIGVSGFLWSKTCGLRKRPTICYNKLSIGKSRSFSIIWVPEVKSAHFKQTQASSQTVYNISSHQFCRRGPIAHRLLAGSGHMVGNKLHSDANNAVWLPKQRKVGLDWSKFRLFWKSHCVICIPI